MASSNWSYVVCSLGSAARLSLMIVLVGCLYSCRLKMTSLLGQSLCTIKWNQMVFAKGGIAIWTAGFPARSKLDDYFSWLLHNEDAWTADTRVVCPSCCCSSWVYLGVNTSEVFLCCVAIVRVRVYCVDFFVFFCFTSRVRVTSSYTEDEPCCTVEPRYNDMPREQWN